MHPYRHQNQQYCWWKVKSCILILIQIILHFTEHTNVYCIASLSFSVFLSLAPHLKGNRTSMWARIGGNSNWLSGRSNWRGIVAAVHSFDSSVLLHFFVQSFSSGGGSGRGSSGQSASIHLDSIFIYSLPFWLSTIVLFRFVGSFLPGASFSRFTFFALSFSAFLLSLIESSHQRKSRQSNATLWVGGRLKFSLLNFNGSLMFWCPV